MPSDGYTYLCTFDVLEDGVPRRVEVEGCTVECCVYALVPPRSQK